ncbi:MAG: DUF2064 domain-containing protein [Chitinophagales bacterium]|nr:DUF2064 domain-containing protein [Chitinophagales bacterium]
MKRTALFLFTRTAESEASHKSFVSHKTHKANVKIASILIRRAEEIAKHCNIPFIEITEAQQHGNNFSERYANAFADVFAKGFENVISIGNDCTSLSKIILQHALSEIENCGAVVGPSKDGGAYLIGFNKKYFQQQSFTALQWQSENLFSALQNYFANQNAYISLLTKLNDIDCAEDFLHFIKNNLHSTEKYLKQLIAFYFGLYFFFKTTFKKRHSLFNINAASLRGPPAISFC